MCIAADSGIDHARALGRVPDLAVGDFDSVSDDGLAWAIAQGTTIERHPTTKDRTDLQIAIERAVDTTPARIVVAAIGGGRVDHLLANVAVLADERYSSVEIDGLIDTALLSVVHGAIGPGRERRLTGEVGELVSLLPVHGDAVGVTTGGLGYPLSAETLTSGTSRGVSNYFAEPEAIVSLDAGTLLAVQPDRLARAGAGASPQTDAVTPQTDS